MRKVMSEATLHQRGAERRQEDSQHTAPHPGNPPGVVSAFHLRHLLLREGGIAETVITNDAGCKPESPIGPAQEGNGLPEKPVGREIQQM